MPYREAIGVRDNAQLDNHSVPVALPYSRIHAAAARGSLQAVWQGASVQGKFERVSGLSGASRVAIPRRQRPAIWTRYSVCYPVHKQDDAAQLAHSWAQRFAYRYLGSDGKCKLKPTHSTCP